MDELLSSIASLAVALHEDRIDVVASAIEHAASPSNFDDCRMAFGTGTDSTLIDNIKRQWTSSGVSGKHLACALRSAARTASLIDKRETIDLVWTGPKSGLIPTRNTEQVIREVVEAAAQRLFVVSYVFYNAASIISSLNEAAMRGVLVQILLEASTEFGGAVTIDGIAAMRTAVPSAKLYTWSSRENQDSDRRGSGAVHAKCAVADHRIAFITSANLTSAAMERNMELGVLVRGGNTPIRLHDHLNALVSTGVISRC